jgi:hypothetical protein
MIEKRIEISFVVWFWKARNDASKKYFFLKFNKVNNVRNLRVMLFNYNWREIAPNAVGIVLYSTPHARHRPPKNSITIKKHKEQTCLQKGLRHGMRGPNKKDPSKKFKDNSLKSVQVSRGGFTLPRYVLYLLDQHNDDKVASSSLTCISETIALAPAYLYP